MRPDVIEQPDPVISLERARLQCKLDGNERDEELRDAIESARATAQDFTQLPIGEMQTIRCIYEEWPGYVALPFLPSEIVSVRDAAGPIDAAAAGRTLTAVGVAPITVTFKVAGYSATSIPGPIKGAMLLMIADLIRNPQGQVEAELFENKAVKNLLWPYRVGLGT